MNADAPHNRILSVKQIRSLYLMDDSTSPRQDLKCDGPGCSNEETKQGQFKKCSRCWGVKYCCKACQIKGWKDGGHKLQCQRPWTKEEAGGTYGEVRDNGNPLVHHDVTERIECFEEKYYRLLQFGALKLLMLAPDNLNNPNQNVLCNKTHVPIFYLEDLPSTAKYPRLALTDGMGLAIPMSWLSEDHQRVVRHSFSVNGKNKMIPPGGFMVYVGLKYKDMFSYTPIIYGPTGFLDDWQYPRTQYYLFANTINAMAAGNANDLVAAIKR